MEVFQCQKTFKLLVCGRRWGKSRLQLTKGIERALTYDLPYDPASPPVVLILMPQLKQAKQIFWRPLVSLLENAQFVERFNNSELRITLKGNKPDILVRGANDDNGDSLRGLKVFHLAGDEWQDVKPAVWTDVLLPALSDTPGSSAMLTATPKGKAHPLYQFHLDAIASPEWSYFHFTTRDNPYFPVAKLREAKRNLPPKIYNQEFRAGWENFEGQVFSELNDRHFIKEIPPELTYYCGVDWGDINPAIVIVGLSKEGKFYIVDSWLNTSGQAVTQDEVLSKLDSYCTKYNVFRSYLPDDRPASIKSAREYGRKHGIRGMEKAVAVDRRAVGVIEGCQIMNNLFFRDEMFIKSSERTLIDQFQSYHRKTDRNGNILNEPADGQQDHLVDATRYVVSTLYAALQKRNLLY
ncbi:hypothetical protein ACX27_26765 [Nostoc piscinale CENA21]|uniref:Terminase n=1 Tax=Nostoc piscinale CENA21 TaxID=224013 RepID=A0A0M4TXW3_9NOSO|nr:hypothetical protein [Nostoc piscinale]ALF55631.1 hypothetical protein ACX27_26765 [Nostoc piscinale CENA21]